VRATIHDAVVGASWGFLGTIAGTDTGAGTGTDAAIAAGTDPATAAQSPRMKASIGLALGAALLLSIAAPLVSLDSSEAAARSCYSFWAEADKMGSHYRHIVYVENDCDYWLQCTVWTDVDPQPPTMLTVGPGMTENRETNGASQYDDPKAFGTCHRK